MTVNNTGNGGNGGNGGSSNGPVDLSAYSSPVVGSTGFVPLRTLHSDLYSRYQFSAKYGFNTQFAGKRALNLILGYDENIDFSMYRYEYERGGIAKRIVEIFPCATWANKFDVVENPKLKRKTPFEKGVDELKKKLDLHQRLIRASKLAYLGRYSVIFIGAPGDPETELPRGVLKNIAYLYPLGEDKAVIESIVGQSPEDDIYDPRYGMPKFYRVNLSRPVAWNSDVGGIPNPTFSRRVHWSRVVHCVRMPLDNDLICDPILKCVWNLLHDLKKSTGGLSEAGLRRGWPGLHANIDKDTKFDGGATSPEVVALKSQLEDYMYGLLNGITTRGVELSEIATKGTISIKDSADPIIDQIAITLGVPVNWLKGSELGLRSSEEDKESANDRIMEERSCHNEPILRQLFKRLSDYGYLATPRNDEYEIEWAEEEELSESEKAEVAKKYKESTCMTVDEIRDQILGLGPMPKEDKEEMQENKGEVGGEKEEDVEDEDEDENEEDANEDVDPEESA